MGKVIDVDKKAVSPSDGDMRAIHSVKQDNIARWKKFMAGKNPDCYRIGTYVGVRLDYVKDRKKADTVAAEIADVIEDKSGHWYGLITEVQQ